MRICVVRNSESVFEFGRPYSNHERTRRDTNKFRSGESVIGVYSCPFVVPSSFPERHNRQVRQDVWSRGIGRRFRVSVPLKRQSGVGRVAAFPSHRGVAARRGIAGSCLFVLLSDKASHFQSCFLHSSIEHAGYASRSESSQ